MIGNLFNRLVSGPPKRLNEEGDVYLRHPRRRVDKPEYFNNDGYAKFNPDFALESMKQFAKLVAAGKKTELIGLGFEQSHSDWRESLHQTIQALPAGPTRATLEFALTPTGSRKDGTLLEQAGFEPGTSVAFAMPQAGHTPLPGRTEMRERHKHHSKKIMFENRTSAKVYRAPGADSKGPGVVHLQNVGWNPANRRSSAALNADNLYFVDDVTEAEKCLEDTESRMSWNEEQGTGQSARYIDNLTALGSELRALSNTVYTSDPKDAYDSGVSKSYYIMSGDGSHPSHYDGFEDKWYPVAAERGEGSSSMKTPSIELNNSWEADALLADELSRRLGE